MTESEPLLATPPPAAKEIPDEHHPSPISLEKLYRIAHRPLLKRLQAQGLSRHDAEDVVQESFVLALRDLGDLSVEKKALSWLYRVSNFKRSNLYKTQLHRLHLLELHRQRPLTAALPFDPQSTTRAGELDTALASCSYGYYFFWAKVLGLKYQEIADMLGEKRSAVAYKISQGGAQLRSYAAEHGIDLPDGLMTHRDPRSSPREDRVCALPVLPAAGLGSSAAAAPSPSSLHRAVSTSKGWVAGLKHSLAPGLSGLVFAALAFQQLDLTSAELVPEPVLTKTDHSSAPAISLSASVAWSRLTIPETPILDTKKSRIIPDAGKSDPPVAGDLTAENRSLRHLRRLMRVDGDLAQASAQLVQHNQRFPTQQLESTQLLMALELDCRLGRASQAKRRVRSIIKRWPEERAHVTRIVARFCEQG